MGSSRGRVLVMLSPNAFAALPQTNDSSNAQNTQNKYFELNTHGAAAPTQSTCLISDAIANCIFQEHVKFSVHNTHKHKHHNAQTHTHTHYINKCKHTHTHTHTHTTVHTHHTLHPHHTHHTDSSLTHKQLHTQVDYGDTYVRM